MTAVFGSPVEAPAPGQLVTVRNRRWVAAEPDGELVYAEQLPRVFNFFRYRLGDVAEAEDLTARTFEKAWGARHRYRRDTAGFATDLFSAFASQWTTDPRVHLVPLTWTDPRPGEEGCDIFRHTKQPSMTNPFREGADERTAVEDG